MSDYYFNTKAIDDGYADMKFNSSGTSSYIPSFVTTFKSKPEDVFSQSKKEQKYIAVEIDNERYVVGDYAMRLDPNIKWIGGEQKHDDKRFPILLKATLGLMNPSNKEVINALMMNLPIRFDTEERRKKLEQIAKGIHEVGISFDGKRFIQKTTIVESVDIKKQPFGSLCHVILNDQGDIINTDLAKGFNVIVDIGARTLNILTIEALEEQPELTTQTNDGMFSAYAQIGDYLENKFNAIIPDGKLPQIIEKGELRGKDLKPLINQAYSHHANNIIAILDKMLINSWGFVTSIIFTGGGASILRPHLEGVFRNINVLFLDRYANVNGLRRYGVRQAKKRNIKNSNISVRVGHNEYRK